MLLKRLQKLNDSNSFFLFGARGTGKSTLLEQRFDLTNCLYLNLLDPLVEDRFARNPNELIALVEAMPLAQKYVVLDEIQKIPKLLDVVHLLIESLKSEKIFIMTGSSSRKLKRAGVNLLAGRAFVYELFPFSFLEIDNQFDLHKALSWGLLPRVCALKEDENKINFLQAYAQTYLKEEIWAEQLVKKLDPFRRFLEVAAQANGKIVNYANISRDVGADDKTVKSYFSLLEDTLVGFLLDPFSHSFRKRLRLSPKFYFFDIGVARALARFLTLELRPSTSMYGEVFEQFIIVECYKLVHYFKKEYQLSYIMTANNLEIDLVVDRPGQKKLLIEIKSKNNVVSQDVTNLEKVAADIEDCETVCFSQDPKRKKIGNVTVYPWQEGIKHFFYED